MYLNMNLIFSFVASLPFNDSQENLVVRALGLDNFTYLASVSGLEGTGMVTKRFWARQSPTPTASPFSTPGRWSRRTLRSFPPTPRWPWRSASTSTRWDMIRATIGKIDADGEKQTAAGVAEWRANRA